MVRTAVFDATDRREYERELLRAKERPRRPRPARSWRDPQQTLIPRPAGVPGLEVAAATGRPARAEVGGDFYDVFQVADDDWVVVSATSAARA